MIRKTAKAPPAPADVRCPRKDGEDRKKAASARLQHIKKIAATLSAPYRRPPSSTFRRSPPSKSRPIPPRKFCPSPPVLSLPTARHQGESKHCFDCALMSIDLANLLSSPAPPVSPIPSPIPPATHLKTPPKDSNTPIQNPHQHTLSLPSICSSSSPPSTTPSTDLPTTSRLHILQNIVLRPPVPPPSSEWSKSTLAEYVKNNRDPSTWSADVRTALAALRPASCPNKRYTFILYTTGGEGVRVSLPKKQRNPDL